MYWTTRIFAIAIVITHFSAPVRAELHHYTEGHADLGLGEGDELELHVHAHNGATVDGILVDDGTGDPDGGQEYEPTDIVIIVPESTRYYVHATLGGASADIASHLGIATGADYWFLPDNNSVPGGAAALHAPFFGLGTEDVDPGVFDNDLLNLSLLSISGPEGGQFGLGSHENGWFMSTSDGITSDADKIEDIPVGTHAHLGWYFSLPGEYQLTFQTSALVGGALVTNENTYTFQVVPEPSTILLLTSSLSAVAMAYVIRRRKA
jgi:surface-anchored protein